MSHKINSRGFSIVETVLVIGIFLAIGIGGWFVWQKNHHKADPQKKAAQTSTPPPATPDAYSGWKTYTNASYGVSFKYPPSWAVTEVASAPSGLDPHEFSANLHVNSTEKYSETATFEVHTTSLASVTKFYNDYFAQSAENVIQKEPITHDNREGLQYTVTNSTTKSKLYLFGSGNKSYSFGSINEELNMQRSSTYWSDFDRVFDSLHFQ